LYFQVLTYFQKMIEWKWSNGEHFERTPRKKNYEKQVNEIQKEIKNANLSMIEGAYLPSLLPDNDSNVSSMVEGAYQQSLLSENDIWSIDGPQFFGETGFHKMPNKREETYTKMSEREIMGQIGQNPFLPNHNYLNDIVTQDQFLKPVSTTTEKEIVTNQS